MNKYQRMIIIIALVLFSSTICAEVVYDVDGDGREGVVEAVHALQVASGLTPPLTPETYTNDIDMRFRLIPAGTFIMGSPSDEPGRYDRETQHEVTLTQSFYIQTTEVTNGQWDAVITDKGRGVNPSQSHSEDHYPVESMNWYEAAFFANYLSSDEGLTSCYQFPFFCLGSMGNGLVCSSVTVKDNCTGYRLPTEAEWEYAARAGTTTPYANPNYDPQGTTPEGLNRNAMAMGWYYANRETIYESGTKPMGVKQANSWGLYDMHGNVHEWCQDGWDGSSDYSPNPVTDPQGDPTGTERVMRGGDWNSSDRGLRSANRYSMAPDLPFNSLLGFRLVLTKNQ